MTESESLVAQSRQLYTIEKLLHQQKISLSDLEAILPALFHINSSADSSLIYVSQAGCDFLQLEREEIMPYSAEQLASLVSEDTLQNITPKFVEFYQEEDQYKVFSSFQQVKQQNKEGYVWVYTTTKIYQSLAAPISLSIPVPQMGQISEKMVGLLEDNLFMRKNYQRFAALTKREREIVSLVVQGVKRRDIAEQLFISLHTYDTHRKNIRKKLELKSSSDLTRYALAFGLVE